MTFTRAPKPNNDTNVSTRPASHPALISLVRLLARSAAGADFERAKAQQEAGHDEGE